MRRVKELRPITTVGVREFASGAATVVNQHRPTELSERAGHPRRAQTTFSLTGLTSPRTHGWTSEPGLTLGPNRLGSGRPPQPRRSEVPGSSPRSASRCGPSGPRLNAVVRSPAIFGLESSAVPVATLPDRRNGRQVGTVPIEAGDLRGAQRVAIAIDATSRVSSEIPVALTQQHGEDLSPADLRSDGTPCRVGVR